MDLQHLTNHGLLMLYQSVRLALEEDDKTPEQPLFEVRQNPDWRAWADRIADELDHRTVAYARIDWGR
jgi:hypothetical protein